MFTLDWLLAVTRRYPSQVQFGLLHINFASPRILGDTYGAQEAAQRLTEILLYLRKSFRKTDLVARDGTDFWVLAPYTTSDDTLVEKTREIVEIASRGGLEIVERDISIFMPPFDAHGLAESNSAEEFLEYLKRNHLRLATQEVALRAA